MPHALSEKFEQMRAHLWWAHQRLLRHDLSAEERKLFTEMIENIERGDVVVVIEEPEEPVKKLTPDDTDADFMRTLAMGRPNQHPDKRMMLLSGLAAFQRTVTWYAAEDELL